MAEYIEENIEFDLEFQENTDSYSFFDNSDHSYSKQIKMEFDNKFPTEYKRFTEEYYKILNDNLILYKTGNAEAAQ